MKLVQGQEEPEAYVTIDEMARILCVSRTTVWRMTKAGEIPSCTWLRRTRRYLPSVVLAALARNEMRAQSKEVA